MRCRKIRYRDRVGALIALASTSEAAKRGRNKRAEMRVYQCPRCKGWHTTSEAPRVL